MVEGVFLMIMLLLMLIIIVVVFLVVNELGYLIGRMYFLFFNGCLFKNM